MHIAVGSDHAGYELRLAVAEHLRELGHDVIDVGPSSKTSVDYPIYAEEVAKRVASGEVTYGIIVCGTGTGVSMAANRVPGARAAACNNEFLARMTRAHNDANVLCLGQRVVGEGLALSIVETFIATPFEGGRHARRVDQLTDLEKR